jgi:hypothetical protein
MASSTARICSEAAELLQQYYGHPIKPRLAT